MIIRSGFMGVLIGLALFSSGSFLSGAAEARTNEYVNQSELQEVYFSFRYRGVGNVVVMGYYRDGDIFLPVGEVFSALLIPNEVDLSIPSIEGYFLDSENEYIFNFSSGFVQRDDRIVQMDAGEYIIDELDFYISPGIFEEVFDLEFDVDMRNLMLRLATPHTMPVVERMEQRSRRMQMSRRQDLQQNAPLLQERSRSWVNGGYLDYNLTSSISESPNTYNYNLQAGGELLAGDVQGSAFGTFREGRHTYRIDNFRWRYARDENPYLNQVLIGQLSTHGAHSRRFNGLQLTNEPVRPRVMYDEYMYEGTASPEAEIEVYLNDRLIAFEEADELGNYRVNIPLTYGSSRIRFVIYSRDGRVEEFNQRIQIPFTFLPPGELNYHISAGMLDNFVPGMEKRVPILQGKAGYGFNNRLSVHTGMEYIDDPLVSGPLFFGSASTRFATSHLMSVEAAPTHYYRINAGAFYSNSVTWNADYTWYTNRGLYNQMGLDHHVRANAFIPFEILSQPVYVRFTPELRNRNSAYQTRYRSDFSLRFNRLTVRAGIQDNFADLPKNVVSQNAISSFSAIYNIPATTMYRLFRRVTLRGRARYNHRFSKFNDIEFFLSRSIGRIGRFRIAVNHSLLQDLTRFEAGISIDFNGVSTNSTAIYRQDSYGVRQNVRGSVGYDSYHQDLNFTNRQQVGRSSTTFRMFVDNNDSGRYEEGDILIEESAIRSMQSGGRQENENGLTRVNQLQPYQRHNFEINEAAIQNPLLVPAKKEFSVITDPNQYKPVDIPFYMTGVAEGQVIQKEDGHISPVAGIRVYLEQTDGDFTRELRTFSGGNFYGMEIPPGSYIAYVDSSQKSHLEVISEPAVHEFEIARDAAGDHIEDLSFVLKSEEPKPEHEPELAQEEIAEALALTLDHLKPQPECRYRIQISYQTTLARAKITKRGAEEEYGVPFRIRFDETYDQFMIFMDYLYDEENAEEALGEIRSGIHSDAFIVEECRPFPDDISYFVELRGVEREEFSRHFPEYAEMQVTDNELQGEPVLELPARPELSEIEDVYYELQEHFPEAGVSVNISPGVIDPDQQYIVQIALYAQESTAESQGELLEEQFEIETTVIYSETSGLYRLEVVPEDEIIDALQLREEISVLERFQPPLIRTVPP